MSKKSNQVSPELPGRAVRMVLEHRGVPLAVAAIESIAPKIGCVPQTFNEWVKRDQIDSQARTVKERRDRMCNGLLRDEGRREG